MSYDIPEEDRTTCINCAKPIGLVRFANGPGGVWEHIETGERTCYPVTMATPDPSFDYVIGINTS